MNSPVKPSVPTPIVDELESYYKSDMTKRLRIWNLARELERRLIASQAELAGMREKVEALANEIEKGPYWMPRYAMKLRAALAKQSQRKE